MDKNKNQLHDQELWEAAEKLISPRTTLREEALDQLYNKGSFTDSPLAAYLLATRVGDQDIEVRFHAIQYMGSLLDYENPADQVFDDRALKCVHNFFLEIAQDQIEKILEIAEIYLAAERSIINILGICSCAGPELSGIVNDRKKAPHLRRQAIFFSGEIGLIEMIPVLENLIQRIEKRRQKSNRALSPEQLQEEESLYTYAVVALGKMRSGSAEEIAQL